MAIEGVGESSKIESTLTQKQKQEKEKEKERVARDGDGKRPKIEYTDNQDEDEGEKAMAIEGDGESSKIKSTDPTQEEVVERDGDEFEELMICIHPGETIDIMSLLFTDSRDFLIRNDGRKVSCESLRGKTIVLYVVPLNVECYEPWSTLDMIEAYNELSPKGDVEFVFVAVQILYTYQQPYPKPVQEASFYDIFGKLPFPAIPLWDEVCNHVVSVFKLNQTHIHQCSCLPYWSIIDSTTNTVEASITDYEYFYLFNLYGGAELYPLTHNHILSVIDQSCEPSEILNNLDQLLGSSDSDFLLKGKGDKVPVSSLKHKVVGLYFHEYDPYPPHLNKVYKEAEQLEPGFEIVQIEVRFHPYSGVDTNLGYLSLNLQSVKENLTTDWLRLPHKDPRSKKLVRIFSAVFEQNEIVSLGGCLVIVQPQRDTFEFSGIAILEAYGIEGYPFTRERLFELEKKRLEESVKLNLLFPPGKCNLKRWENDRYLVIDNAELSRKKVLVLFASHENLETYPEYVTMLSSKYKQYSKEKEFEVVYVSFGNKESKFDECIKTMPWLVHSYSKDIECELKSALFKCCGRFSDFHAGLAAFGVDGELITKYYNLNDTRFSKDEFPFISLSLDEAIFAEVRRICELDSLYSQDDSEGYFDE